MHYTIIESPTDLLLFSSSPSKSPKIVSKYPLNPKNYTITKEILQTLLNDLKDIKINADKSLHSILVSLQFHPFFDLSEIRALKSTLTYRNNFLGHHYSIKNVQNDISREDNLVVQCVDFVDILEGEINALRAWFREMVGLYLFGVFKEYSVEDVALCIVNVCGSAGNQDFNSKSDDKLAIEDINNIKDSNLINTKSDDKLTIEDIKNIKDSNLINSNKLEKLQDLITKIENTEIPLSDLKILSSHSLNLLKKFHSQRILNEYIESKLKLISPNLSQLLGALMASRLISKSGSLNNLAKSPASTVQLLGAEKALFRALKSKSNTPKYGILYHSNIDNATTNIGSKDNKKSKNGRENARRIRKLANKAVLAARIDCYTKNRTGVFSEGLFGSAMKNEFSEKSDDVLQRVYKQIYSNGSDAVNTSDTVNLISSNNKNSADIKNKLNSVDGTKNKSESNKISATENNKNKSEKIKNKSDSNKNKSDSNKNKSEKKKSSEKEKKSDLKNNLESTNEFRPLTKNIADEDTADNENSCISSTHLISENKKSPMEKEKKIEEVETKKKAEKKGEKKANEAKTETRGRKKKPEGETKKSEGVKETTETKKPTEGSRKAAEGSKKAAEDTKKAAEVKKKANKEKNKSVEEDLSKTKDTKGAEEKSETKKRRNKVAEQEPAVKKEKKEAVTKKETKEETRGRKKKSTEEKPTEKKKTESKEKETKKAEPKKKEIKKTESKKSKEEAKKPKEEAKKPKEEETRGRKKKSTEEPEKSKKAKNNDEPKKEKVKKGTKKENDESKKEKK